jgi:DNA-binding LacI/PurR family transcriptional regulator
VTVRDVAEAAGVSTATVTRALQGHSAVRDETRSKVEAAARRLDYRPDRIARALVTRTSSTVGMLIPSSVDSFWGEVAAGIEETASEANYSVLLANSHSEPERERRMIEVFLAQRVAGVIIAGAAGESSSWFRGEEPDVPLVVVNWDAAFPARFVTLVRTGAPQRVLAAVRAATVTGASFVQIVFDDFGAAQEVVRHLVSLGHERIAFVGAEPIRPSLLRVLGFRSALSEAGLAPGAIVSSPRSPEGGFRATQELLASSPDDVPTAIVAYDDATAIGVIRAVHALGIEVPGTLSVIGFDDIEMAAFSEPPLTTIRQPRREMGRMAMRSILSSIRGEPPRPSSALPGKLVLRRSTAPPSRR